MAIVHVALGYDPAVGPIEFTYDDSTIGGGTEAGGTAPPGNTGGSSTPPYVPPPAVLTGGCKQNVVVPGTLTGTVQRFEDLPTGTTGDLYKIAGTSDTSFAPYYVLKKADGTWDESRAPAMVNAIDPFTMPHALVRKSDGTFEFAPFCWKPRAIGDTSSNPEPPFVGRAIRDVFFYQSRLAFLADESATLSVTGDYGNFWRRTVVDYLDTDTISVSPSTTDVALLDYALPFSDGIMLFSEQRQFALSNGTAGLSPTSIEINPVTDYTLAPGVRPIPYADQVYFATAEGGYTSVQEYTRLDGRDARTAADITAHVPGLIPAGVTQLIPLKGLNGLVTVNANSATPSQMNAYQFFWDGDKKIISAWRRWSFGAGSVVSGGFSSGLLSLIVKRDDKAYLETMDMRAGAVSDEQDHMMHLDRQVTLDGTYDSMTGLTTFTFPYHPDPALLRMVRTKAAAVPESLVDGAKIIVSGTTVTVEGDESAHPVTAGEKYLTAFRLSEQFAQDYQFRPITDGRLQLRSMAFTTYQTPFYTVEVLPYGANSNLDEASRRRVYNISAQRIGYSAFVLGKQSYLSGAVPFTVGADATQALITVANDTPFGSSFVSGEWEGTFFSRSR